MSRLFWKLREHGHGCVVGRGAVIKRGVLSLGNRVFVGPQCWISVPTSIGDDTMLAARVGIVGGDHPIDGVDGTMRDAGRPEQKPVKIGSDVWIGYGATILHGVTIGDGAVVAAGAIVTKDVGPLEIVAGTAASLMRARR